MKGNNAENPKKDIFEKRIILCFLVTKIVFSPGSCFLKLLLEGANIDILFSKKGYLIKELLKGFFPINIGIEH